MTRILSAVNQPQPRPTPNDALNRLVLAMARMAHALKALDEARHELHEAMAEADDHDSGHLGERRHVDAGELEQPLPHVLGRDAVAGQDV